MRLESFIHRSKKWIAAATVAGVLAAPSIVLAEEGADEAPAETKFLSVLAGFDVTTAYYFRGLNQEDTGFIIQPYLDLGFNLGEYDGFIQSISANIGTWNSVHGVETGETVRNSGDDDFGAWYENDLYGSITLGMLDILKLTTLYTYYQYPNGAFDEIHELAWKLAIDDTQWLGDFKLSPYVMYAIELGDDNLSGVSNEDEYLEVGIAPGFLLLDSEDFPVTVSFPVVVGMSLDGYYVDATTLENETFGYVNAGVLLAMPLSFIPEPLGAWTVTAGVNFLFLGDGAEEVNAAVGTSDDDDFEIIGKVGLSMAW